MPMPTQKPCSAAMTGLSSGIPTFGSARISVSVDAMLPVRAISLMSEPAQNAFSPPPVVGDLLPDFPKPLLRRDVERVHDLRPVDGNNRNAARTLFEKNRHKSSTRGGLPRAYALVGQRTRTCRDS